MQAMFWKTREGDAFDRIFQQGHDMTIAHRKSVVGSFSLSILFGLAYQISSYNTLIKAISLILGLIGLVIYMAERQLANRMLDKWLLLALYMLLVGVINARGMTDSFYTLLRTDLSYIMFTAIGFALADDAFDKDRVYIFRMILLFSIACGAYAILNFKGSIVDLLYRNIDTNYANYVLWGVTSNVFAYAGYFALINKENELLGLVLVLLNVILGLLFQKRSVIADSAVLIVFCAFNYLMNNRGMLRHRIKVVLKGMGILLVIFACMVIIYSNSIILQAMVNQTFARITGSNLSDYDRQREANNFVENSSLGEKVFGYGIGYYLTSPTWGIYTMLHIGYYNLLYKGGVFYILFWLYILRRSAKALRNMRYLDRYSLACLFITLSAFVSMVYEFSWSEMIMPVCFMPFVGHICMINYKTIRDKKPEAAR